VAGNAAMVIILIGGNGNDVLPMAASFYTITAALCMFMASLRHQVNDDSYV
jgi:ribose 5-phosphate isomerase RpiB